MRIEIEIEPEPKSSNALGTAMMRVGEVILLQREDRGEFNWDGGEDEAGQPIRHTVKWGVMA